MDIIKLRSFYEESNSGCYFKHSNHATETGGPYGSINDDSRTEEMVVEANSNYRDFAAEMSSR
ncbi:hypothetical protein SDJN02_05379 [Cucurbita argyrosperma subsp. argyrosperma]|nr:hypothetical protein SDJN02_05379 [Cucurbita argyrosperma subsp. argyrosperma]